MTRVFSASTRVFVLLAALVLGLVPSLPGAQPDIAFAQSADPKDVSPQVSDLRPGFQFVPEKSEQREPVPGIIVYEADFVRDQNARNFRDGPIEIKSLVAKTANSQQAAEQFASSRQALTTASPAWVESRVAKLGDESTGLSMEGTSSEGPAVAHLFLFRRGSMVVGITVAGLTKPTRMAEAEGIAAIVLRKIDPAVASQTGPRVQRTLRSPGQAANTSSGSGSNTSSSQSTGPRVRVANTGGTGVRLRVEPSTSARVASVLPEGTMLDVVGDDRQADGYTWKNVRAPGDGRGWVASQYVTAVSGGTTTTTTSSQPSSPQNTSSQSSSSQQSSGSGVSSSNSPADVLKVDVSVKQAKIKGNEQTVQIVVTKGGRPVQGVKVTVKTSPTGETPNAPETNADGKSSATWKPTGSPGFIGVGVSALAPDGSAGVGGASFEITN